jgi:hypothetical protein
MNCEDFESSIIDLAREQVMEASVRARAFAHRDECEACARRLEDESALSFGLHALANETKAVPVPALGSELLAALRSNIRSSLGSNLGSNREAMVAPVTGWRRHWATAAVAVAAMILVVITFAVVRLHSTTPPTGQALSIAANAKAVEAPIAAAPGVVALKPVPASHGNTVGIHKTKRRNLNQLAVDSPAAIRPKDVTPIETAISNPENSATEITTEFMPVGYASETSMQEGGQLVRVELPRSALLAFGLPMNVNRYDEKVKADVFFGADGMARAIRFVQ